MATRLLLLVEGVAIVTPPLCAMSVAHPDAKTVQPFATTSSMTGKRKEDFSNENKCLRVLHGALKAASLFSKIVSSEMNVESSENDSKQRMVLLQGGKDDLILNSQL
ncbi:unnamed protein product [Urochloa humidicola]